VFLHSNRSVTSKVTIRKTDRMAKEKRAIIAATVKGAGNDSVFKIPET
jgi:hypothetical protein